MRILHKLLTLAALGLAVLTISGAPLRAMSGDSSGYAVVLPWVISSSVFNSQIAVENHSGATVKLVAYYVGESQSANPTRLTCSDASANPVPQTFSLSVAPDAVLSFDLKSLIDQKCKGSKPSTATSADRGTLTLLAPKTAQARISASARVERVAGAGIAHFGYSQAAVPLGGLEGTTQIVTGVRSGKIGTQTYRVDCLVGSLYDASQSGNWYKLTVKDASGTAVGKTLFALKPWSAELLVDVLALIGSPGLAIDAATIEIEPAVNPTNPSMIASCRMIEIGNSSVFATVLSVGKVYEPKDELRARSVSVQETPGIGLFVFDAKKGRSLHVAFLRQPDMVECSVSDPQLALVVTSPNRTFVTGGFQSTGEFFTGFRGATGDAGAFGFEVIANQGNPPSGPVTYELNCVSGNGMSQIDRVIP